MCSTPAAAAAAASAPRRPVHTTARTPLKAAATARGSPDGSQSWLTLGCNGCYSFCTLAFLPRERSSRLEKFHAHMILALKSQCCRHGMHNMDGTYYLENPCARVRALVWLGSLSCR